MPNVREEINTQSKYSNTLIVYLPDATLKYNVYGYIQKQLSQELVQQRTLLIEGVGEEFLSVEDLAGLLEPKIAEYYRELEQSQWQLLVFVGYSYAIAPMLTIAEQLQNKQVSDNIKYVALDPVPFDVFTHLAGEREIYQYIMSHLKALLENSSFRYKFKYASANEKATLAKFKRALNNGQLSEVSDYTSGLLQLLADVVLHYNEANSPNSGLVRLFLNQMESATNEELQDFKLFFSVLFNNMLGFHQWCDSVGNVNEVIENLTIIASKDSQNKTCPSLYYGDGRNPVCTISLEASHSDFLKQLNSNQLYKVFKQYILPKTSLATNNYNLTVENEIPGKFPLIRTVSDNRHNSDTPYLSIFSCPNNIKQKKSNNCNLSNNTGSHHKMCKTTSS